MNASKIIELVKKGEGTQLEFKKASIGLNKDAFDSICGFLNRSGGHLILGVEDQHQEITGIQENQIQNIVNNIITSANNPERLNPPFYLSPEVVEVAGKKVVLVYVPESSQVHAIGGKIFDRNQDGDFNITKNADLVAQLYLRKQNSYSENEVFPLLRLSNFENSLFEKVRVLAKNQNPAHPWLSMDNSTLLKSSGLYKKDMKNGKEGYTLAAALLFGKDEVIQNVLPHYKTDAILRLKNIDRYDDREDIRTNLIDSYEKLMAFIAKHLPDKFNLVNGQRINVRDHLFREIIGNLLVHREYKNPFPAKLIIEKNKVNTENWNKANGSGSIDPFNFSPYPKNPIIAKFFKSIGWVDELGSGIRNTFKLTAIYSPGKTPSFIEGDIFKISIPIGDEDANLGSEKSSEKGSEKSSEKILKLLSEKNDRSAKDLSELIKISPRAVEKQLASLQEKGKLKRIGPAKGGHWKVLKE